MTDPGTRARLFRWLPLLLLVWTATTVVVETRMDRLVMRGANIVADGDFDGGPPASPNWEYGGLSGSLWGEGAGIEGTGALKLGDDTARLLRYRLGRAWQADGYFLGVCLRGTPGTPGMAAADGIAEARAVFRRSDTPMLRTPGARIAVAPADDQWHCGLRAVSVPLGLDELVLAIGTPPGVDTLYVDRVTIHPASSPPLYQLLHRILVAGWVLLGGAVVVAVFSVLGAAAGTLAFAPALLAGALAIGGTDYLARDPVVSHPLADAVGEASDAVFQALRIFTGDSRWRSTGAVDPVASGLLFGAAFLVAWAVMLRFRWHARPWRRLLWYGVVGGFALQGVRLLFHAPTYATPGWLVDPLVLVAGLGSGALVAEFLLRVVMKRAV